MISLALALAAALQQPQLPPICQAILVEVEEHVQAGALTREDAIGIKAECIKEFGPRT